MNITFSTRPFSALSSRELYDILALRSEVFVVEQQSIYHDPDGKDLHALHLCGYDDEGRLMAYARLLPAGMKFEEANIGRVIIAPYARKYGLGHALIQEALKQMQQHYPDSPIRIEAQAHLKQFYEKHGFSSVTDVFILDGIPHIEMRIAA